MRVILTMIIERPNEITQIKNLNKWTLLYGRRKTGKTFLVTNFVKYDEYFFVKSNKNILSKDNQSILYETFIEILRRTLENNKTVVVDEFHRLDTDFFEFLHAIKKQGKLILISSTLFLSTKLISSRSPLLGLFAEIPISLINLKDCLKALEPYPFSNREKLELAIILKEPITAEYFAATKRARETLAEVILGSIKTIPALIGEVFSEEERTLSAIYEGILRAIAMGNVGSGEISSYLFSKKLIKKDDPSIIQQYLNNLVLFGIIKKMEVFNKKRFIYKLYSPLSRMYFYADEKYNIAERKITEKELLPIIDELMPRMVEDSVREFLAEKYGLRESIAEAKDFEIDGCLLKFKKPEIVLEVKWKKIDKQEVIRIEENLRRIDAPEKIIFVQDKKQVHSSMKVMDPTDL